MLLMGMFILPPVDVVSAPVSCEDIVGRRAVRNVDKKISVA